MPVIKLKIIYCTHSITAMGDAYIIEFYTIPYHFAEQSGYKVATFIWVEECKALFGNID